jgi:hypothetical protein
MLLEDSTISKFIKLFKKLLRVRLCDWSTQVVSVVYFFRLQRLKKEQHPLRLLQSLPTKMSLLGVPHSVSVNLKSIQVAAFWCQISCSPTIYGSLSRSPVSRRTWDFPRYQFVSDDFWSMNDLPSSCLSSRWWLGRKVPKPWHKWNYRPNRVSTYLPISLPSQLFCQHSNSLTLDKGRQSERWTGACHSMPFSTASLANWSALPPHVTGSTSCEFHAHCSSATNRPLWFHIPTSESLEQPSKSAGPFNSSCYRSR